MNNNVFLEALISHINELNGIENEDYPFEKMIIYQLEKIIPYEIIGGAGIEKDLTLFEKELSIYTGSKDNTKAFIELFNKNNTLNKTKEKNDVLVVIQTEVIKYFKNYLLTQVENGIIKYLEQLEEKINAFKEWLVNEKRIKVYTDIDLSNVSEIINMDDYFDNEMDDVKIRTFTQKKQNM